MAIINNQTEMCAILFHFHVICIVLKAQMTSGQRGQGCWLAHDCKCTGNWTLQFRMLVVQNKLSENVESWLFCQGLLGVAHFKATYNLRHV